MAAALLHTVCLLTSSIVGLASGASLLLSSTRSRSPGGGAAIVLAAAQWDGEDERPMMGVTESMRAMACWGKPNLLNDEKCIRWLLKHCSQATTGIEICSGFLNLLKEKCEAGGHKEEDPACKDLQKFEEFKKNNKNVSHSDWGFEIPEIGWPHWDSEEKTAHAAEKKTAGTPTHLEKTDVDSPSAELPFSDAGGLPPSPAAAPMAAPSAVPQGYGQPMADKSLPPGGLPDQGVNEYSRAWVSHKDADTQTSDWGTEWPRNDQTEGKTKEQICQEHPDNGWCKLFLAHREQQHEATRTKDSRAGHLSYVGSSMVMWLCLLGGQ